MATEPVTSVALLIDGQTISTLDAPPYAFTIDATSLSDGNHTLAAEAATVSDRATSAEIGVRIGAASAGGGPTSGLLPIAAIAVIGVVAVLAVLFVLRRRRGRGPQMAPTSPEPPAPTPTEGIELPPRERIPRHSWGDEPLPPPQAAPQGMRGLLRVTGGDLAERTFPIGRAPISIGTGYRCLIALPEAGFEEIATEHVRVWMRDDQLVVHELRRLTAFGPTGGRWEFLTAGDTFAIGPHTFTFELIDETLPAEPAAVPPAPVQQAVAPGPSQPEVPNILRERPPAAEPAPAPPALAPASPAPAGPAPNEIPNILRDRPGEAASPPPTTPAPLPPVTPPSPPLSSPPDGVPQILRERPPVGAEETSAPASGVHQASEAPPEQTKDESAA